MTSLAAVLMGSGPLGDFTAGRVAPWLLTLRADFDLIGCLWLPVARTDNFDIIKLTIQIFRHLDILGKLKNITRKTSKVTGIQLHICQLKII